MTEAFVRRCNKCQKPFLKEDGCNRMKCSCGNTQCYVCSDNISDYMHFDEILGKCPMYGDMRDHIKEEVAKAQEVAVQKLLRDRTELREEDIRVDKKNKLGEGNVDLDSIDELPFGALRITTPAFTMENPQPITPPRPHSPHRAQTYPQVPLRSPTMYYEPRRQVEHTPPYRPGHGPPLTIYNNYRPPICPLQIFDPPPIYEHAVGQTPFPDGIPYLQSPYEMHPLSRSMTPPISAGHSKRTGNKLKRKTSMKIAEGTGLNRPSSNATRTVSRRSNVASFRSSGSGVSAGNSGGRSFGNRNSK